LDGTKEIQFEENMEIINRSKVFSFLLIAAYLLAACSGALPPSATSAKNPKVDANVVAFHGIVEAMNGKQWTVNGQTLTLGPNVSLDPNLAVGDEVKVEANVSADGTVVAFKVESTASNESLLATPIPSVEAGTSSTPDPVGTPSSDPSLAPNVSSTSDPSVTQAPSNSQNEIFGTVEALTSDTITVNGITYPLARGFTEIKGNLAVGDPVKLHVMVNADGSLIVREIEKSAGTSVHDSSSNSNSSDDGPNHDVNDDTSNGSGSGTDDGQNHDGNDDHGGRSGNNGSGDD
jgi:uncharacterized protein DUF5666